MRNRLLSMTGFTFTGFENLSLLVSGRRRDVVPYRHLIV
jgi:hypothetical protein